MIILVNILGNINEIVVQKKVFFFCAKSKIVINAFVNNWMVKSSFPLNERKLKT